MEGGGPSSIHWPSGVLLMLPAAWGFAVTTAHPDPLPWVSTALQGAAPVRGVVSHTLSTCTASGMRAATAREWGARRSH